MKSEIKGRWFEEEKNQQDEGGALRHVRVVSVCEYLGDGSFAVEGHLILKEIEDGNKTELFVRLHASGTWTCTDEHLYEKYTDYKMLLEEAFYNDAIIVDEEPLTNIQKELVKNMPIPKTSESKLISLTAEKMIYESLNDEGVTEVKVKQKTLKAYSKYFS